MRKMSRRSLVWILVVGLSLLLIVVCLFCWAWRVHSQDMAWEIVKHEKADIYLLEGWEAQVWRFSGPERVPIKVPLERVLLGHIAFASKDKGFISREKTLYRFSIGDNASVTEFKSFDNISSLGPVAVSHDQSTVAVSFEGPPCFVSLLDVHTKREILRADIVGRTITGLSFSPDDSNLLVDMVGEMATIIDCRNGNQTNVDGGLQTKWVGNRLLGFARVHDGFLLFYLRDIDTGTIREVCNGGPNVSGWDWSPDGRYMVFGRLAMGATRLGIIPWPGPDLVLVDVAKGHTHPLGLIGVIGQQVVKPNAIIWRQTDSEHETKSTPPPP